MTDNMQVLKIKETKSHFKQQVYIQTQMKTETVRKIHLIVTP